MIYSRNKKNKIIEIKCESAREIVIIYGSHLLKLCSLYFIIKSSINMNTYIRYTIR